LNATRPSLPRPLSLTSLSSRKTVEPNLALPPIFKTVSYKVDAESIVSESKLDKSARSFKQSTWHLQPVDDVARSLGTDKDKGLTHAQYHSLFKLHGANSLSDPPTNWFKKLMQYLFGGFGLLLMVGGILCCIAWKPLGNPNPTVANLVLGVVLFIVFFFQAFFNFWQDFSSSRVMSSINGMIPSDVSVVREGVSMVCQAKELVPGDLIFVSNGDRLSADVRFVSVGSSEFAFDKAILTGESKPVYATSEPDQKGSNYLESSSIGLQGTFCVGGSGYGIVVSTGDHTVFGQIAKLTSEPKMGTSPLQKDIIRFVIFVVSIALFILVLICILWGAWIRKEYPDWIPVPVLIVDLVSVFVAFIPEGLPIALTTCLMITAGVMRKNMILCKSLSVVETLGSVSVLCSDKTGTLTKNKMSVVSYAIGGQVLETPGAPAEKQLSLLAKLCNAAAFNPTTRSKPLEERLMSGNATDQAIYRFGYQLIDEDIYQPQRAEVSFNSKNKFMIRLFEDEKGLQLMIKGAPDILLQKCTQYLTPEGEVLPLDEAEISKMTSVQESWAEKGQRVVLLAYKRVEHSVFQSCGFSSKETIDTLIEQSTDLILAGLVGIADPPKDDILDVVTILHGAGIRVMMVTGDFEATAVAIARMCGIVSHRLVQKVEDLDPEFELINSKLCDRPVIEGALSITGNDLDLLNDSQWEHLTSFTEIVFSRTTPEQKLKIVEEFQKRKHIVAMTGDGVNDAPSLRQADVGIGMSDGSDIAKEAADLVLLDSFSSIVTALKFGRLVFENLRKTLAYVLPAGCYAELWAVLLNVIFGLPQMLSSFNMIMISCLTDCAAAITLAYEKPEKSLLTKQPRSISGARLIDWKLVLNSYFILGTYCAFVSMMMSFLYLQENGIPFSSLTLSYGNFRGVDAEVVNEKLKVASSIYFITLVILQFFNLMSIRTRYASLFHQNPVHGETANYALIPAMAFALGVTFFFNYIPWFQQNLGTGIVPWKYYLIACAFGSLLLTRDELRKYCVRRWPKGVLAKVAW
jgi:sodium/potassium-transporting ATPase subunit alpha/H+/K+-exchanging ATPase